MKKISLGGLLPKKIDKTLLTTTLILLIYGTLMIVSAEMGNLAGSTMLVYKTILKQIVIIGAGLFCLWFFANFRLFALKEITVWILYGILLVVLLSTRLFGASGGAYGWIRVGSFSIQPSEFCKVFIIYLGAYLLGKNEHDKEANMENLKHFVYAAAVYFVVVLLYQHDLGSAFVLAGISYISVLLSVNREYRVLQNRMILFLLFCVVVAIIGLSPIGTAILSKMGSNYMIGRFLASADPFKYQYDVGYHLIMGLVSFANGGLFGLGYGNSIHKYMNFPNPSSDFILPVIVEEMGIVFGLIPILLLYGIICYRLAKFSLESQYIRTRMVLTGTFMYVVIHFVLNAGGVSGLIPLTGVPLLLISAGGSCTMAFMSAIGMCLAEYNFNKVKEDESNSGQI